MADVDKWADTSRARRASRLAEHRSPRREQIIRAAAQAIEEYGAQAGTGQIAEIAGVARPHVYRHFSSRDELMLEVARYAAGDLKASVRPSLRRSGGTPTELIRGLTGASVAWAAEHPGLYRFITERKQTRDLHRDRVGRSHFLGEIVEATDAYLGAAGLTSPPDGVVAGLMGMGDASIIWWLDHRDEPREELVDRLTRQVWLILREMLRDLGVEEPDTLTLGRP